MNRALRQFTKPFTRLNDNPIAHYEQLHIERSDLIRQRRRYIWLLLIPLLISILLQIAIGFTEPIARLINRPLYEVTNFFDSTSSLVTIACIGMLLAHNMVISSTALRLASGAIARERQGRTWESLILTTLTARRLVFGKWWGVMGVLWSLYRWTLLMRGILGGWLIISAVMNDYIDPPAIELVILAAMALTITPVVNAFFYSALGVIASAYASTETTAVRISGAIQAVIMFVFFGCGWCILSLFFLMPGGESGSALLFGSLVFTLIEGGSLSLLALIDNAGGTGSAQFYFLGVGIWVILFTNLTFFFLRVISTTLTSQGALRR